jgi:hypothetical protein
MNLIPSSVKIQVVFKIPTLKRDGLFPTVCGAKGEIGDAFLGEHEGGVKVRTMVGTR